MASASPGSDGDVEPGMANAIATRFGGDAALYREFAADCAAQFALDVVAGRAACEARDLSRLRRLAHDLKSALTLLGHDGASSLAALVEGQAAAGEVDSARLSWQSLDTLLTRLGTP